MKPTLNPREQARIKAGYKHWEDAAKRLGITPRYLRSLELGKPVPFHTAERLCRLYRCPMNTWL